MQKFMDIVIRGANSDDIDGLISNLTGSMVNPMV